MLRYGFIDFDSIFRSTIRSRFDSIRFFYDLHTSVDPTRPRGNGSAAVLATHEAIPHRRRRRRLEQGRC